jgi:hypothetical protein
MVEKIIQQKKVALPLEDIMIIEAYLELNILRGN